MPATGASGRATLANAFVAGFIAVLVFHQGAATIVHLAGLSPNPPFPFSPTRPFGVPLIWSWAFWGGIWGIIYSFAAQRFPRGLFYWVAVFLFGAIAPVLVLWFVVLPLRGAPIGGGFRPIALLTTPLIHGAWGVGTGLLLRWRP